MKIEWRLASASAIALAVAMGAPAVAQEPPAQPAQPGMTDAAPHDIGERLDVDTLLDTLQEMGIEDLESFGGTVVRGEMEGQPFVMLIGPQDFAHGEVIQIELDDFAELRDELGQAGLDNIAQDFESIVLQGRMDGHAAFATAVTADPEWQEGFDADAAGDVDANRLAEALGEAGIEDTETFEGQLYRASVVEGEYLYLLIGQEGLPGAEETGIAADDVRDRFQEAGLRDPERVEDELAMVRGTHNGHAVLALAGSGLIVDAELPVAEPELTEEQLRTFAEAVLQVQDVAQQYGLQIEAAETEEEQQALREEALDEAMAAVEGAGLEVAEYEAIAVAVQEDPEVAQQVAIYLREALGAPPVPAEPAPPAPPAQ